MLLILRFCQQLMCLHVTIAPHNSKILCLLKGTAFVHHYISFIRLFVMGVNVIRYKEEAKTLPFVTRLNPGSSDPLGTLSDTRFNAESDRSLDLNKCKLYWSITM